jgi:hypothetical protein
MLFGLSSGDSPDKVQVSTLLPHLGKLLQHLQQGLDSSGGSSATTPAVSSSSAQTRVLSPTAVHKSVSGLLVLLAQPVVAQQFSNPEQQQHALQLLTAALTGKSAASTRAAKNTPRFAQAAPAATTAAAAGVPATVMSVDGRIIGPSNEHGVTDSTQVEAATAAVTAGASGVPLCKHRPVKQAQQASNTLQAAAAAAGSSGQGLADKGFTLQQLCDSFDSSPGPEAQQQLQLVKAWVHAAQAAVGPSADLKQLTLQQLLQQLLQHWDALQQHILGRLQPGKITYATAQRELECFVSLLELPQVTAVVGAALWGHVYGKVQQALTALQNAQLRFVHSCRSDETHIT